MARKHHSVVRRQRKEIRQRARNTAVKSRLKTLLKTGRSAVLSGQNESSARLAEALRALDKAAARGIIHRNTAARKKSRLLRFAKKYAGQSSS